MKKLLLSTLLCFSVLAFTSQVNADVIDKPDFVRLQKIGNQLIRANKIPHRYTFNFTNVSQQKAYPILIDTSYTNDLDLHNNHCVNLFWADYARLASDDEVAGLIAHELAQGEHSYTGVLNGQFMFTKNGYIPFNYIAKMNELNFDKKAVDYMAKAGYNPKALTYALNKTTGEWRGTFFSRHNKTQKRVKNINQYISQKYPKL